MIAVYQRELKSYFTGMIGFVIITSLFLFIGLYYSIINIINGHPYFGKALSGMASYLSFIIPLLTMKSMSEDRKTKTDQILLTAPVSTTQVVMGKYLAMVTVFAIPVLYSMIFPLLMMKKDSHNILLDYATILAFFLYGSAFIAIGMFISSLTESQIIAAVITFVVFFGMMLLPGLTSYIPETSVINAIGFCLIALLIALLVNHMTRNPYASCILFIVLVIGIWVVYFLKGEIYTGALSTVLNIITFSNGIMYFSAGVFNVQDIVMFISVGCLFVFLTVQSVQKRRWN